MPDRRHVEILNDGVESWNRWRSEVHEETARINRETPAKQIPRALEAQADALPDLNGISLAKRDLSGIDLLGASLREVVLEGADLTGADLRGSDLSRSSLRRANLTGADLSEATAERTTFSLTTLTRTRLQRAKLTDAVFGKAVATHADFSEAQFTGAEMLGMSATDTTFCRAHMAAVDLRLARFVRCDLRGTMLALSRFVQTDLKDVKMAGAHLGETLFADVDLSGVSDLADCEHGGPSSLDTRTLARSGKLPVEFLRGCGTPEALVSYLPSLFGEAITHYTCFISFNEEDDAFVRRLYEDLQERGIRCWRWKEDAPVGRTLMRSIDEAVRVYDKLVLVCSEHSPTSPAVLREVERALQREDHLERQGKEGEVLIPIRLDNYVLDVWDHHRQADVKSKHIGDFRQWQNNEAYKEGLDRLARDLQLTARTGEAGEHARTGATSSSTVSSRRLERTSDGGEISVERR